MDNKVELMREGDNVWASMKSNMVCFLSAEGFMLFQHCYILLLVYLVWNVSVYTDLQWFSIICKNCVSMILEQLLATHQVVNDRGFKFWIKLCIGDDRVKSTQSYTEGIETPETVPSFLKIVFGCLLFDNITDNFGPNPTGGKTQQYHPIMTFVFLPLIYQ